MASPIAPIPAGTTTGAAPAGATAWTKKRPIAANAAMARILSAINAFCVVVPVRTPSALIAVKAAMAITATAALDECVPLSVSK